MFTNKHVIVALLVTPLLAIFTWFAVDAFVGETPHSAVVGQSYPLMERSNCRYDSGQCDLRNEDMQLTITLDHGVVSPRYVLSASQSLDRALLAVAVGDRLPRPERLVRGEDGRRWTLDISELPPQGARMQVVVQAGGSNWFADASTTFLDVYRKAPSGG